MGVTGQVRVACNILVSCAVLLLLLLAVVAAAINGSLSMGVYYYCYYCR
jgi:hypothetical protein